MSKRTSKGGEGDFENGHRRAKERGVVLGSKIADVIYGWPLRPGRRPDSVESIQTGMSCWSESHRIEARRAEPKASQA